MFPVLISLSILMASAFCYEEPESCTIVDPEIEEVLYGWPFSVRCEKLFVDMERNFYIYESSYKSNHDDMQTRNASYNATCVIIDSDSNSVLLNRTVDFDKEFRDIAFNILDFSKSNSLSYEIRSWFSEIDGECYVMNMSLRAKNFISSTCKNSQETTSLLQRSQNAGKPITFPCVPPSTEPSIHSHILPANHSITWYRNCEKISTGTGNSYRFNNYLMTITNLSFEHLGLYTCAITHNGMQRFVRHYRLCVSPEQLIAEHTITCTSNTYYSTVGGSVAMACVTNIGMADNRAAYTIKWHKKLKDHRSSVVECSDNLGGITNQIFRKSCTSHSDHVCYESQPSVQTSTQRMLVMEFKIRRVLKSDFGEYMVALISSSNQTTKTFNLVEDATETLTNRTVLYGILIAFVASFILMMGVLWWNRIYLQVLWKRKFGTYSEDNKKYGAYFAYYFSDELDKFSQRETREAVAAVREALETLGYSVFDECKDGCDLGGKAETSLEQMQQCHRVVIILTSAFLKDQWNLFILQQGFKEMIKSKSKLIFVLVPGIRQHLKQHSADNDTLRMARTAVKLNGAIEWANEKLNSKELSLMLEYEMPKLRSQQSVRHNSTASSISSQVQYKNGIRRTVSSDTRCTELALSDSSVAELYIVTKE